MHENWRQQQQQQRRTREPFSWWGNHCQLKSLARLASDLLDPTTTDCQQSLRDSGPSNLIGRRFWFELTVIKSCGVKSDPVGFGHRTRESGSAQL